ncbi:polysaccharide pyruvyl transferase family protein [Microbacterium sp. cx-59]|uniref:polysaccharide pyruvyl transferase family protein n=1 Tax=Microbacterium sp. cx-59 TaxID=2891207 RepID=UPI001E519143|nr:polysaccharide pyruvyl transferase family protein [Microbacterium sp. cx-59]MCC4908348.1 polysaccharide pyruvyl transferase family protein [Microbacterium sp. cx-59]
MTVLAIGDIGVLNGMFHVGDEAMFDAAERELRRRGLAVVGVSSATAESTARYGIPTVARLGFVGLDRPAARERARLLVDAASGTRALPAGDDAHAVLAALDDATGVLHTGGGNLATRWPVHIYERTTLTAMAAARGIPVVFSGQTFGPDLDEEDEGLLREALATAALVGVREPTTEALVRSWGTDVRAEVDDASFLDDLLGTDAAAPADAPGVLVSLSGWYAGRDRDEVERGIAQIVDDAAAIVGGPVVFHAHFGPDDPAAPPAGDGLVHERVRAAMATPSVVVPTGDTASSVALARSARLLISSRYHPVVFAAPAGVPVLALAADAYTSVKLGGALGHWGQGAPADLGDPASARVRLREIVAEPDAVRAEAAARHSAHRARTNLWWDDVADVLGG